MIKKNILTRTVNDLQAFADQDLSVPLVVPHYKKHRLLMLKQTGESDVGVGVRLLAYSDEYKKKRHDFLPFSISMADMDGDDEVGISIICNIFDTFASDEETLSYVKILSMEKNNGVLHAEKAVQSLANVFYILRTLLQDNQFREYNDENSLLLPIVDDLGHQMDVKKMEKMRRRLAFLATAISTNTVEEGGVLDDELIDMIHLEMEMAQVSDTGAAYMYVFYNLFKSLCHILEFDNQMVEDWIDLADDVKKDGKFHDAHEADYHMMLNMWHELVAESLPIVIRKRVK